MLNVLIPDELLYDYGIRNEEGEIIPTTWGEARWAGKFGKDPRKSLAFKTDDPAIPDGLKLILVRGDFWTVPMRGDNISEESAVDALQGEMIPLGYRLNPDLAKLLTKKFGIFNNMKGSGKAPQGHYLPSKLLWSYNYMIANSPSITVTEIKNWMRLRDIAPVASTKGALKLEIDTYYGL